MREVSFTKLSDFGFNITDISCVERIWKNQWANEYPGGRDTNVLSFTLHGNKNLYVEDMKKPYFSVTKPSAFFIAEGFPYVSKSGTGSDTEQGHTICIKFRMRDDAGEPISVSEHYLCWQNLEDETVQNLFSRVIEAYLAPTIDYCTLKARLYNLIRKLVLILKNESIKEGFDDILPALNCIHSNLYDRLSVEELSKMCFVSRTHFCARFKEFSGGDSLVNYRNRLRVQKAIELLGSPLWTMEMIAPALGFYDLSHFYRVFKKFTGTTPLHYKNSIS